VLSAGSPSTEELDHDVYAAPLKHPV
jgi:hypothetical protein